jgi:hypothetical protein
MAILPIRQHEILVNDGFGTVAIVYSGVGLL